jgi:hypothetical protein
MKKLTFILSILISFTCVEIIAQTGENSDIPLDYGGNGTIFRNAGGADRPATSGVYGNQGQWSTDLTISEKTSAQALSMGWEGTSHNGMGATGWGAFTAGAYNRASGNGAFVGGFHNVAGPTDSDTSTINGGSIGQTAFGYGTLASGNASFTSGQGTEAGGSFSTAAGYYSTASDYGSFVIGSWNSSGSSATSATSFSTSAPAFVIGNGTASNAKSDAFKVMFNGDATVSNDLTVSGDIVVSSDARLKSNIVSLGSTLSRLLLIDGKSYEMKGKQKIGVLAQEIKEVFPELVSEDENEMLAVNYQGLVPVLINALKEQDNKISNQQLEIEKLKEQEKRLEILERLVAQFD